MFLVSLALLPFALLLLWIIGQVVWASAWWVQLIFGLCVLVIVCQMWGEEALPPDSPKPPPGPQWR